MNEKEVQEQINIDYEVILNNKYSGNGSVPSNIVEIFKKAVVALPPQFHKVNFTKIQGIVTKKSNDLTHGEINEVFKLIFNTPLEKMFDNIETAIPEMIRLEKFAVTFNTLIEEFQQKLQSKSAMLKSLSSGVLGGKNGKRIIN